MSTPLDTRRTDPPVTPPPTGGEGGGGEARWVRPFVAIAAVAGLLLLGAAGGLLIGLPGPSQAEPTAVDIGFAQDMSVHHQQAVQMASWERDHTTDPELAQLATDIEGTQGAQVGRMQGWLELWNAGALPIGGYMGWMADAPGAHAHTEGLNPTTGTVARMPGMATTADLDALRAATGQPLDVLFLQLMLRHHEGGAEMLRYGAANAAVPQVRNLAAQMLSSQESESEYMRQLLTARGGTPLPL